jgi:hypothetical protein
MASRIEKDVRQRVPHLARCPQYVQVVAVGENGSMAAEDAVHGSRQTRGDGFHAGREIPLARRLDDRMQVIVLERVLHQSKAPPVTSRSEAALELANQPGGAKRGQVAPHLQRDVAGMTTRERRTPPMRIARIRTALAPGTRASSTPARCIAKTEIELPSTPRHDSKSDMQV